jgi:hypothetical protein
MNFKPGVLSLFLALAIVEGAAAQTNLLPLAPGNSWTLTAGPYSGTLSVTSYSVVDGVPRATIAFNNPWTPFSFLVRSTTAGIMLEGIQYPSGTNGYPDPVVMFGVGTVGQTWNSSYVNATLVSNNNTIVTPNGTYTNVVRYDLTFGSSVETWYLAPNVGFVQFGAGTGLELSKLSLNTVPAPSTSPAGTCPNVGITANPKANGDFSAAGKEAALKSAIAAGSNFMTIETSWALLEPSPGSYDMSSISAQLALAAKYSQKTVLLIKTIDTTSRTVPSDLASLTWNDPHMISRWQGVLKAVLAVLNSQVKWLELGNEVDTYLTVYPAELSAYSAFIQAGQTIISGANPALSTGVVYSFDSWRLSNSVYLALNPQMQNVAFTYYDANATVPTAVQRAPGDVAFDFADMVTAAGGKPLVLTEVGYASSTAISSSPALQQTFYSNALTAFAGASGKLTGASFSFMSDFPAATDASLAAAYGPSGSSWVSWIGTLGLFDSSGNAKPAWSTFQAQATPMQANKGCVAAY